MIYISWIKPAPTKPKQQSRALPVLNVLFCWCYGKKATSNETTTAEAFTAVDVETYKSLIAGKGVLVDVRTAAEFSEGKIEGASNVDWMGDDFEIKIQELDKETPVYIYCTVGGKRSVDSMQKMKELGFKEVYNLEGGLVAWNEKKLP